MFNFLKSPKTTLAIAAIFRNEKDYILEWIAWHQAQGVHKFIIYDNDSDDGTTQLLQQLEKLSIIDLHHIERQENVQIKAYQKILTAYKNNIEIIAFIDADEFIVPSDSKTVSTHIAQLFKNKKIGALGINWKVFGTNSHQKQPEGSVIQNYPLAGNDKNKRNHFIKSIYRPKAIQQIFAHRAKLNSQFEYINTQGNQLIFSSLNSLPEPTKGNQTSGVSSQITANSLRIHHYALKSVEEFTTKKKYKGDAILGKNHIKSNSYFKEFDLNDEQIIIPKLHLENFQHQFLKLTILSERINYSSSKNTLK